MRSIVQDRHRSIVRRARRLAALVVLLSIVTGAGLSLVYSRSSDLLEESWVDATDMSTEMIRTAGAVRAWEDRVATFVERLRSDPDQSPGAVEVASYRRQVVLLSDEVDRRLERLELVTTSQLAPIVDRIVERWRGTRSAAVTFDGSPAVFEQALGELGEIGQSLERLSTETIALYEQQLKRTNDIRTWTMWVVLAVFVLSAAILAVAVHKLASRIASGISRLVEGTERLAANDLSHRVEAPDELEFAELADRFNLMAERLGAVQARLSDQARRDALTELPNRRSLLAELEQEVARSAADIGTTFGLLDLDGFKEINDSFGHPVGDEVLVAIAGRLRATIADGDVAARLGGDEFGLVLHGQPDEVERRVRSLLDAISAPITLDSGVEVAVEASTGLVPVEVGGDAHELLRNADVAMYRAKDMTPPRRCWFEPHMQAEVLERNRMQRALGRAISQDQFLLHFQPIVDSTSGTVSSVECLVRWDHPELGVLGPDRFIPVAETTGMIEALGDLILVRALGALEQLDEAGGPRRSVSINLSPRQLIDPLFVHRVRSALDAARVDPRRVVLEVTESVWLDDIDDAVARLEQLAGLGVRLSLDDFGTGYSSLSYLNRLPLDVVKLDRALAQPALTDQRAAALVAAVLQFSEVAGLTVVAEGVETREHQRALVALGCTHQQGYLYSRPVPLEELVATVEAVERSERLLLSSPSAR